MDEKLKKILPIVLAVVLAGTGIVLSSRFVSESNTVHKEPEIVTEIYVPDTAVPLRELKYNMLNQCKHKPKAPRD